MKNTIRVLGLDVSKSSVSACLLLEKPDEPRQFYYNYNFLKLFADKEGIKTLLELRPDVVLLEPTGTNYSRIWKEHLEKVGIKVLHVGHKELRNYRAYHLGLPDKDDNADSLALACYWFDYNHLSNRFVANLNSQIIRVRELVLRLEHLNRIQSPIINRLRQDLAWQFPEAALITSKRGKDGLTPLLWGWIAKLRDSRKYDAFYKRSIGLGLEQSTRDRALLLCNLQQQEFTVESELQQLLSEACFVPYYKVFNKFCFGSRLSSILIAHIYPLEIFLKDGKPEIKICRGRISGKPTKHHISLRKFQKTLGMAPSQEQSGDKRAVKANNGSKLCRKALWQWVFATLEPRKRKVKNEIINTLCTYLDAEKASGKPVQLIRSRVAARAVKLLFRELVKELNDANSTD
ncbi:hypothetical protein MicvaDRAFT_1744 [Calothrix sp. PCC 7716]|nr:hypothetical protein MicvaDRAFT_1744 [Calothrix sp. PCC 7716]